MELKHSRFGIASFTVAIGSAILIFLSILAAGIMEMSTPGGINENSPPAIILGLLLLGFLFVSGLAFCLGIGGLFEKERKKIFAVLGTLFSALTILATASLIIYGMFIDS